MSQMRCLTCGKTFSLNTAVWRCDCGGLLDIEFESRFEIDAIDYDRPGIWRYRLALPIEDDNNIVSLGEGVTPLLEIRIEGRKVLIKQDHLFPTGSYKDRGASVLISKVKELGINHVVEDSSGNAGAAIAAYCARAGITCDIYVPASTSPGKLKQIRSYGAILHEIDGDREAVAQAAMVATENHYYASHCWNPFFMHGVKTFAYEICRQMKWRPPDTLVLPVGNGTLLLGAYAGFNELLQSGIIKSIPKLVAIQAKNCAPIYHAFHNKSEEISYKESEPTIAEGIAVARPVRGKQILAAIAATNGDTLTVSEDEIQTALNDMHRCGYYIEPTSASTIAGLKRYLVNSNPDETVASVFTGHGLKK